MGYDRGEQPGQEALRVGRLVNCASRSRESRPRSASSIRSKVPAVREGQTQGIIKRGIQTIGSVPRAALTSMILGLPIVHNDAHQQGRCMIHVRNWLHNRR
jgi:hypothetical protein